jgi:proline iminopeptidase
MKIKTWTVMKKLLYLVIAGSMTACNGPSKTELPATASTDISIQTGGSKLIEIDGKYKVWTKKIGDGKIKVLLLHGGPGIPHDYMECYESFLPKAGIQFYFYDQLGCGNSDIPTDTSLYHMSRFVEEVEQVRKGLGLENFFIVGHSWGGMLAMEYLHKYQSHVRGAILSNMTAGMKDYTSYTAHLKQTIFTKQDNATYDSLDRLKKYDSPEFSNLLMNKLYTHVLCRMPVEKWPEPLTRSFKKANFKVYIQMQGVDEFHVTGNFKNWEYWDKLPQIKVPTLVIGAKYDEMNPESLKKEGKLIPNSRTYICPNGSHMAMYDDQRNYFASVISFLKDVDNNTFKADVK